ncbi:MAG: DEAD/DEAH box helicase family protein [Nitrososphaerales archaeon]
MDIEVNKYNESFCIIKSERNIIQELSDYFSFYAPGYKFVPSYKNRLWDGKIRLARMLPNGSIQFPLGLISHLDIFANDRELSVNYDFNNTTNLITEEELVKFISELNIHSKDVKLEIRDYQISAVLEFLNNKRRVLLSPTSSGKSVILYIIVRYLQDILKLDSGILIVPNVSLCNQIASDFNDYSSHNNSSIDDHIHTIYSGKDKNTDKFLRISTWQSLATIKDNKYFSEFDFVIGDECHLNSAKISSEIIDKCVNSQYRLGVTGTLNGTKIHSLQLESLFGMVKKIISTKELMDKKQVTKLDIKSLVLKYPEETCKLTKGLKYQDEINFLISNTARNNFIKNLCLSLEGNTLLLYQYVENHGRVLYDLIRTSKYAENKIVYFIHGNVDPKEREKIRHLMEEHNNVILIGSVGTVSTGTNIRNLHNLIFASPTKSVVRTLQSVGRILRLNTGKDIAILYDIADDLSYKKHVNYTLNHFKERLKIYSDEKFNFKIKTIELK